MSMLAKNQAVNLPKPPKRPWHASQFGHHTKLTCSAELSQQRLQGLSCYYWQCVRDISASSRKGRWLPSLVMQPVLLKTSPPPPRPPPQLPPHLFLPSTPFQMTSLCGLLWLQKCSECEARACWTNPSSGVQDCGPLRSSKRVFFFFLFLLFCCTSWITGAMIQFWLVPALPQGALASRHICQEDPRPTK